MSTKTQFKKQTAPAGTGGVKWFKTDVVYDQPHLKVDEATGIINDVSVCTVGEAKGHGVQLDQEFVDRVAELGNQHPQGLKCRFGHPSMSNEALGTYTGRFKNFRVNGNKAIADLHLDDVAKKAPNGDLYGYVIGMAQKNPDMFGSSIVFTPGKMYQRDKDGNKVYPDEFSSISGRPVKKFSEKPWFIECEQLHATDLVDEPAANEGGLFSSAQFNADKFAVRIDEFLNSNPDVWAFIGKHPEKVEPFIQRYNSIKQKQSLSKNMKTKKVLSAPARRGTFFKQLAAAIMGHEPNTNEQLGTVDTTTTDGNNIRIVTVGDQPAVGDLVYVVDDQGNENVCPDGDYTIASGDYEGDVITVTDGAISAITKAADAPATDQPPADPGTQQQGAIPSYKKLQAQIGELTKQLNSEKKKNEDLRREFDAYKKNPIEAHTQVGDDDAPEGGTTDKDAQFYNKPWNKKATKPAK